MKPVKSRGKNTDNKKGEWVNGVVRAIQSPRFWFLFLAALLAGCTSAPPPSRAALQFERAVPERVDALTLQYQFTAANSRSVPLHIEITGWKCIVNGTALAPAAAELTCAGIGATCATTGATRAGTSAAGTRLVVEPLASAAETLILRLDLASLGGHSGTKAADDYHANLLLDVRLRYGSQPPLAARISAAASVPRIRPPEFTITAIAILQADLINTRFRVGMRIDNPNPFPLNLSGFAYQLYGGGVLWAEGGDQDVLPVPAESSAETSLALEMNFIGMPRRLFDEIVSMREVDYRFTGTVDVAAVTASAALASTPRFRIPFDRRGRSAVLK
jgi:LEA14-like dessication related protein